MADKDADSNQNTLVLRTKITFSDEDLTDEAKKQFQFHQEILNTFRFFASHILSNEELTPIGRHLLCTMFERHHMHSKLVLNYIASGPELKTTTDVLSRPLVICGLPRTGTTLLYNLLNCDPACRAPLLAEMAHPVPPLSRSDNVGQIQRGNALQGLREIFNTFGLNNYLKEMRTSHPQFAIEEDIYLYQHTGCHWFHPMLTRSDDDELLNWFLDATNKAFVYDYHKTFMTMLNDADAPSSHWLFKAPQHILYIDEFLRHYPSAMFIMTHRCLNEVFSSTCRLVMTYASVYFDKNKDTSATNIETIVKRALRLLDTMIHRHITSRRNYQNVPCFDIQYDDLVAQPIETIRRIYNHFGFRWSKEFELAMHAWLRDNPQGKQGRNVYTMNDCGMTHEDIEQLYKQYISIFLNSQTSPNTE